MVGIFLGYVCGGDFPAPICTWHHVHCGAEGLSEVGLSEGAVLWESLSKAFKDSSLGEQAPFDP